MNKSLTKNALLVSIKTIFSLIMPLITFPYITRTLQVNAIGQYNFALSIVSYFVIFAELGITTYAIREGAKIREDKERFTNFANEIISINIISTLIAYISLFIIVISFEKFSNYYLLIMILSIQILLATFSKSWIYNIYEEFGIITIAQIISQLIYVCCLLTFIKTPKDIYIYSFFSVLSTGLANIFYGVYANKYLKFKFHFKIIVLKKHIKPILLIFSSTIASTIYVNSDISILGWIIGDYSVGIYSTSVKIYTIVKQVMLAVISVTIPRLTAYTETAKFKSLFNQVFNMLFTILFPAAIGLYCISENIVLIIAGEAYLEAVLPLQILSIALIFALLACIFGTGVLIPYRREDIFLYATIISAILNILLNLLLIPLYKQNAAALTTLIAEIVVFLICFIKSKEYLKSLNYSIIKPVFFGGLGIYLLCNIIKLFKFGFILETFLCILLSAIVYIFIELILKNEIIFDIYKKGIHILKRN